MVEGRVEAETARAMSVASLLLGGAPNRRGAQQTEMSVGEVRALFRPCSRKAR